MASEIEQLIEAVKSLKPEFDIIQQYIYPIALSFFSAVIGGVVSLLIFKWQVYHAESRENIKKISQFMCVGIDCLHDLMRVKEEYFNIIGEIPLQRASNFPPLLHPLKRVTFSVTELVFLTPVKRKDNFKLLKYAQIPYLSALVANYNSLSGSLEERTKIDLQIKKQLLTARGGSASVNLTEQEVYSIISPIDLTNWIDLTELCINQLDDLLIEFNNLIKKFPDDCEIIIYGKSKKSAIVRYEINPKAVPILARCPPGDYSYVTNLFHMDEDQLRARYESGRQYE